MYEHDSSLYNPGTTLYHSRNIVKALMMLFERSVYHWVVVGEDFDVRSYESGLNLRLNSIKGVPIIRFELRIFQITEKSLKCTFTLNQYFRINAYSFPTIKFK